MGREYMPLIVPVGDEASANDPPPATKPLLWRKFCATCPTMMDCCRVPRWPGMSIRRQDCRAKAWLAGRRARTGIYSGPLDELDML